MEATDGRSSRLISQRRMPDRVLHLVIHTLFGPSYASCCVNSALSTNMFEVPFVRGKRKKASEVFGKHANWSILVVYFKHYALLGDDILIADDKCLFGYEISGVLLCYGVGESSKRYLVRNLTVALSVTHPLSVKNLMRSTIRSSRKAWKSYFGVYLSSLFLFGLGELLFSP
ncbi:hypothetical protein M569_00408 [Genlisea aurea]|uniref:Uncharacterized protein n=1 Tax=Genlisea aurea TaxID=192259 RepID=S8DA39_9LAMI|nr:hypothetical protein M569_00408 [Genlisea aurea]